MIATIKCQVKGQLASHQVKLKMGPTNKEKEEKKMDLCV